MRKKESQNSKLTRYFHIFYPFLTFSPLKQQQQTQSFFYATKQEMRLILKPRGNHNFSPTHFAFVIFDKAHSQRVIFFFSILYAFLNVWLISMQNVAGQNEG